MVCVSVVSVILSSRVVSNSQFAGHIEKAIYGELHLAEIVFSADICLFIEVLKTSRRENSVDCKLLKKSIKRIKQADSPPEFKSFGGLRY